MPLSMNFWILSLPSMKLRNEQGFIAAHPNNAPKMTNQIITPARSMVVSEISLEGGVFFDAVVGTILIVISASVFQSVGFM